MSNDKEKTLHHATLSWLTDNCTHSELLGMYAVVLRREEQRIGEIIDLKFKMNKISNTARDDVDKLKELLGSCKLTIEALVEHVFEEYDDELYDLSKINEVLEEINGHLK